MIEIAHPAYGLDQLNILMHSQMQRNVWLDNIINLRQYTVGNLTSLCNVTFQGW